MKSQPKSIKDMGAEGGSLQKKIHNGQTKNTQDFSRVFYMYRFVIPYSAMAATTVGGSNTASIRCTTPLAAITSVVITIMVPLSGQPYKKH